LSLIYFLLFLGLALLLLLVFAWSLRPPRKSAGSGELSFSSEDSEKRHVIYMPQVQQALSASDAEFLARRGGRALAQRVQKERRAVALAYLTALHEDFENIQRLAKAIAILSPEVIAVEEFERVRLSLEFSWRCQVIHARLLLGLAPRRQLSGLSDRLSGLTLQIEAAMRELGERAALAAKLASSLNRPGGDIA
jgi:hypothetical protein